MTKEMLERIENFVEVRGLYPQPCGAPIAELCRECGISEKTFERWSKNDDFVGVLTRAREKFHDTTVRDVENALVAAAQGAEYSIINEEKKLNPATGKLETVKATRKTFHAEPNIDAAKFVLSNMQPERWKMKQEQTIQADVTQIVVRSDEERQKLEKIAEGNV